MFRRNLRLPPSGSETFFLWGPRQTGQSALLRESYPDAHWLDLLKAEEYLRHLGRLELLREELASGDHDPRRQIVIESKSFVRSLWEGALIGREATEP